jgi:hypothetical protein
MQTGEVNPVAADLIPFNRRFATGKEIVYAAEARRNFHLSSDGNDS